MVADLDRSKTGLKPVGFKRGDDKPMWRPLGANAEPRRSPWRAHSEPKRSQGGALLERSGQQGCRRPEVSRSNRLRSEEPTKRRGGAAGGHAEQQHRGSGCGPRDAVKSHDARAENRRAKLEPGPAQPSRAAESSRSWSHKKRSSLPRLPHVEMEQVNASFAFLLSPKSACLLATPVGVRRGPSKRHGSSQEV